MISVSALVSGEQLGRLLAKDSEEAARALLELAKSCDVAELTDLLEDAVLGQHQWTRERLSGLMVVIKDALERTQR
jgi:hypothetical protein